MNQMWPGGKGDSLVKISYLLTGQYLLEGQINTSAPAAILYANIDTTHVHTKYVSST